MGNVEEIVNRIKEMPCDTETTVAELMQMEQITDDPLTQGKVFTEVKNACKELGIKIEENRDEIGGLAYHIKFKKVN